jgi:hypothetical protein
MIEKALQYTRDVFNQYLKNKFGLDEDAVLINRIVDQSGSSPKENINKVVLSVIHLGQETNQQFYNKSKRTVDGNYVIAAASQRYNIYILVVPHFDDYKEGLKFLNASLEFFQTYSLLNGEVNSKIPDGISKLEFQLEKGDGYMQMQNLWTALGAKFQPSIVYMMKLITIDSGQIEGFDSKVSQISNYAVVK